MNKLRERWASGKATINGWLTVPSAFSAELVAKAGWDSVTVDMQHGVQDYMAAVDCFRGIQAHGSLPMARVPGNEPNIIGKILDAGAVGVICPLVNTKEDAELLVNSCRYPPRGNRSFGPLRASLFASQEEIGAAICLPMIETRQGVENLSAILSVPGIDGVYIGPADLGLSHGLVPRLDREEPQILDIFARAVRETKDRGQVAGIHCGDAAYATRAIAMGFRLVTVGGDARFITLGATNAVRDMRKDPLAAL